MKRKTYMKPTTQVVILQQQSRLLSDSPKATLNGSENPEEIEWP